MKMWLKSKLIKKRGNYLVERYVEKLDVFANKPAKKVSDTIKFESSYIKTRKPLDRTLQTITNNLQYNLQCLDSFKAAIDISYEFGRFF